MSRDQVSREAALDRRVGPKPEKRVELNQFWAEQTDWRGTCRVCKCSRTGTLAQVKAPCQREDCKLGQPR